ncbi:MAG: YwaF family protein, partial [Clostridia bacterium]
MQNFFKFWSDIPNELAFPSFGALHIAAIASVFVLLTAALVAMRKLSARGKRGIICACSIILPLLEISRIVWLVYTGEHNIIKLLPLHLCTMQMFFIPLAVFSRSESVRDFVFF